MKKMNVKIEGITPLLMNRFLEKQIVDKIKKRSGEMKELPAKEKLYEIDGKPYIPAIYFIRALVEAGKQFKIVGRGKATYSKFMGATIDIEPEAILINPNKWEEFRISSVNPNTRGRMMITRPRFEKWGAEFEILCEDDSISADTIQRILEHAGHYVGVGDWRPEKKGKFGKFRIAEFKEGK